MRKKSFRLLPPVVLAFAVLAIAFFPRPVAEGKGTALGKPMKDAAGVLRLLPSAHAAAFVYCPTCPDAEQDHIARVSSMNVHGQIDTFTYLVSKHPEAVNAVNLIGHYLQFRHFMSLTGAPSGQEELGKLARFAASHSYDIEDFFLHWSEPTRIEHLGGVVEFDGTKTTLRDKSGVAHVLLTSRAVGIQWTSFYYNYDWHFEGWYQFEKMLAQEAFADLGGYSFDGYFQDAFSDSLEGMFQGIKSGGGIAEFGGKKPSEAKREAHDLAIRMQRRLNADFPGKVFLPNVGNYMNDDILEIALASDGIVTEMVVSPSQGFQWEDSWNMAQKIAKAGKFYVLSAYWDAGHLPADYPAGIYATSLERARLQNMAWYWMMYEPGRVLVNIDGTCCDWTSVHTRILAADIGNPVGARYLADQGTLPNGWKWTLWARKYEKGTVYYRGNAAWRDGNGGPIGYGANTKATFKVAGDAELLREDGSWVAAPSAMEHMEGFGWVLKARSAGDRD